MKTFQKIGIALLLAPLCFGLVFGGAYAPQSPTTPKAHAAMVVVDFFNHVVNAITSGATTATAGATVGSFTISNVLNGIAWAAAKQMIQVMTKSIVNWINSGYQGSPGFVTNLNSTLLSVANAAADSFIRQLATSGAIKSPFQTKVASAVQNSYNKQMNGGFFALNPYTLNSVTKNDSAFLNGNFSQGGFNAWMSAWSNPANNPYGAYMLASNALSSQVSSAQGTRQSELNWSKGFLSWRGSCKVPATTAPSSLVGLGGFGSTPSKSTSLSSDDTCLSYDIQTPGSVIESQLENTLGSPIRQLELTNSINEIIGAAVTQLTTSVLGSTGLLGLSHSSSGSNNSAPINAITSPAAFSQSAASIAAGASTAISTQQQQISQYQANWTTIQTAAAQAKAALSASSCGNAQQTIATQVQPVLDQAASAIARAAKALQKLSTIQQNISKSGATNSNAAATNVTTSLSAANDYQSFLSSPDTPSNQEITDALTQSSDNSQATDTPPTLVSRMQALAKSAQSCGVTHGT